VLHCAGPPHVQQQPANQQVFPGQTAYFSCWVDATPQATVTWFKDERPLHMDETRMLVLPSGKIMLVWNNLFFHVM
jgi:hypothetical protein